VNKEFDERRNDFIGGSKFTNIVATARKDNIPSNRLIQKFGFNKIDETVKFGKIRYVYNKNLQKSQFKTSF